MKYLTTYKIFESVPTDVIQTVRDILLDAEDDGFDIQFGFSTGTISFMITKKTSGDHTLFIFKDIKDVYLRVRNYLETEGWYPSHKIDKDPITHKDYDGIFSIEGRFKRNT